MIWKNLFRRKSRTLLTAFGIAIGVAAVVALGALADGFIAGYGDMAGGSGADLLVIQEDALDIVFSAVDQQLGERLKGFSGVTAISEMVYTFAATEDAPYFIVYGYEPGDFALEHFKITEGESFSHRSTPTGGKPLLLGHSAAEDMELGVGDTLRLYETTYRVVGIYETGQPIEDGAAVVLMEDAQSISGKPHQVNAFLLKVRPGTDITRLRQRIGQHFPNLTTTTSSGFSQEQEMLQYVRAFTWGVSFVAILIGGVGVMNTVLMSVFERTREFGVLRAIGWRPLRILGMVLGESLGLSLLGGAIGVLLGVGAAQAVQNVPTISSFMPTSFSPTLFAQGMGVAVGLGMVGGAIPAWRASRLMPAEAMRNEGGASVNAAARHVRSSTLRSILRQPIRTILTIVGIGIAIIAIVLLRAMGDGVVTQFTGMAGGMGAHLMGSEAGASVDLSKLDENVVRRLNMMPEVRAAEGFLTGYTEIGDLPFFIAFGYQPRGLAIREYAIVEGEPLQTNRQMLLGRVAADNLNKDVGDTIRIFNSAFEVVGIYETGVSFQDGGGVIPLRAAQKLFGQPDKVSFLSVWLKDPQQADAVIQEIETRFPEVDVGKASEFTEDLSDIEMMRASTWGIAALALVVGGLGMTNTMIMSVFERTREIGVLRALGWGRRRVLGMIVRESVTLSLIGGIAGIILGVAGGLALNASPVMEGFLRLEFSFGLFAQALGTAAVLGIVGGVYPAWRASNLQPVEALRYE
jgi:ABC-type antimicrobial peptide transport system permease subunit